MYKRQIIYGGIAEKVFTAAKAAVPHQGAGDMDGVAINAEALKQIYDHLVSDAGAEVLFGSTLCGVEAREGEVSALLVAVSYTHLDVYKRQGFFRRKYH